MEINKKHFIQVFLTCLILVVICEFIGQRTIAIGKASIVLFPMLYAVIIGLIITPDLLGKKIKALKKVVGEKEINKLINKNFLEVTYLSITTYI